MIETSSIELNFLSEEEEDPELDATADDMSENVEFIVPQAAQMLIPPREALSMPISIVYYSLFLISS